LPHRKVITIRETVRKSYNPTIIGKHQYLTLICNHTSNVHSLRLSASRSADLILYASTQNRRDTEFFAPTTPCVSLDSFTHTTGEGWTISQAPLVIFTRKHTHDRAINNYLLPLPSSPRVSSVALFTFSHGRLADPAT